jgi:hypothetical protein
MALNAIQARALKLKEIAGQAARYIDASDKIKPLEAEKKKLSGVLKEFAETLGETDEKGTAVLETNGFVIKSIASKKQKIDHAKAVEVLRGLNLLERCTMTIVDEKALEVCFQEGLIDLDTINSFATEEKGSSRVSVERA